MTDGIIQNIINKYKSLHDVNPNDKTNDIHDIYHETFYNQLVDLQQELIEEIKKTIPNSCAKFANAGGDIFYSDGEEEILRLLIGDNQE